MHQPSKPGNVARPAFLSTPFYTSAMPAQKSVELAALALGNIMLVIFREIVDLNQMVEFVSNCFAALAGFLAVLNFMNNYRKKLKP